MNSVRNLVRRAIRLILLEDEGSRYFIHYSGKAKTFVLYRRFRNAQTKNEDIEVVRQLSSTPELARQEAKEITGRDLPVKTPGLKKPKSRGDVILQYGQYKGERVSELPLLYIFLLLSSRHFMSRIKEKPQLSILYEHMTEDIPEKAKEFIENYYKGLPATTQLNAYKSILAKEDGNITPVVENTPFSKWILPVLHTELQMKGMLPINGFNGDNINSVKLLDPDPEKARLGSKAINRHRPFG